jgi:hypothetical protein
MRMLSLNRRWCGGLALLAMLATAIPVAASCGMVASAHSGETSFEQAHDPHQGETSMSHEGGAHVGMSHGAPEGDPHHADGECPHSGTPACSSAASCGPVAIEATTFAALAELVSHDMVLPAADRAVEAVFLALWRPPPKSS